MEKELSAQIGKPYPLGVNHQKEGCNFAIAVKNAEKLTLCLFDEKDSNPFQEIEMNTTGDVWHIFLQNLPNCFVYAYRISQHGKTLEDLTLDPYAKSLNTPSEWGSLESYHPYGKSSLDTPFDWQGDQCLDLPKKDLVIYEMHVRGFTRDESSGAYHPGTFLGVVEKIPYLKKLGINAVELMPIHEFNENECHTLNPETKQKLHNYFGYSTVNFFSPMNRYASTSLGNQSIVEFKTMVRELHKNGIEVILDVVYNHTAEGNQQGPHYSFKELNLNGYYMIDPQGNFLNFSGCGNTFNCNHPWSLEHILQSLRYWVTEMHVDGFRLDLASILTRDQNGAPHPRSSVVEAISQDPILSKTKMIAEAWDAAGLYQVGGFYPGDRWSEWNGRYRDNIRKFIKGTPGFKSPFATALCGSQDVYGWRGTPTCSINFVTAHDGFSLADLVCYNDKHNEINGENNRDGFDHNDSWNCGIEGHSSNKKIILLRERQIRNFHLALMVSQGIPMLLMGDEYAHTRHGNNNTWCQDNQLNWFLWDRLEVRPGFHRYFSSLIDFRKNNTRLWKDHFLTDKEIAWHGLTPFNPDWGNDNHFVAFTLIEDKLSILYIAFNALNNSQTVKIPPPPEGKHWIWIVNTFNNPPDDFYEENQRKFVIGDTIRMHSYSAIMLKAI